jgi:hypothetical protein
MTATTWPERMEAFERHRRAQCRLIWSERVREPASNVIRTRLRHWASRTGCYAGSSLRITLAVVSLCLRPLGIARRVRRCSPPGEADTARALAAAACFDPDAVDWTSILSGPLGVKLNALRHERGS